MGLENRLWFADAPDSGQEHWSQPPALECNIGGHIEEGVTYEEPNFDCGGEIGTVGEGARVNYQLGAVWRRWKAGMTPILGYTPPGEWAWVVHDREEDKTFFDVNPLVYTFETSSWGLDPDGPTWNPECQDRECDCDERVLDYLGTESYHVNLSTYWWLEWSLRWDEYVCADQEWGDCECRESEPINAPHEPCPLPPGVECDGWYGRTAKCDRWGWTSVQDPSQWCDHPSPYNENWCIFDLRLLGFDPVREWTGVVVAGADGNGNRCGSWTDRWPHYIPIPVIEIQPVGTGWQ